MVGTPLYRDFVLMLDQLGAEHAQSDLERDSAKTHWIFYLVIFTEQQFPYNSNNYLN